MDKSIQISLTEFMDYVNSSGAAKATVVVQAKRKREEGHNKQADYWMQFRNTVKSVHSSNGTKDDLYEVIEKVHEDRMANYNAAVNGYVKFWGKRKFGWIAPPRKVVNVNGTRVALNPELGLSYKGKIYFIKLFIHIDEILDKRHADLILSLLHNKLGDYLPEDTNVAVLDVMRGKLFEFKKEDHKITQLLEAEGASFNILWDAL